MLRYHIIFFLKLYTICVCVQFLSESVVFRGPKVWPTGHRVTVAAIAIQQMSPWNGAFEKEDKMMEWEN